MSSSTFNDKFEQVTQVNYYVGLTRFKDVRLFNYTVSKNSPNMVGISSFVDYIEVENSVDFSFRVARIGIKDFNDLRKNLPIMGNEIFYIEYDNIKNTLNSITTRKHGFFRVIGLEESTDANNKNPNAKGTSRYITLVLAEYPYVDLLTFNGYNKTYNWDGGSLVLPPSGPKPISLLVSDMFQDPLSRETINTMGITYFGFPTSDLLPWDWINYYSPNWSKLKNINFLKRFATSLVGDHSYYFLNCESNKIVFKSIYMAFLSPLNIVNKIDFVPVELYNLIPTYDISPSDVTNTLMDVTFKGGNLTDAYFGGLSGETKFSFDYLSGHTFSAYDYRLFKQLTTSNDLFYINFQKFGNQSSLNSFSPFNPKISTNLKRYEYSKKSFNSLVCEATTFINNGRYLGQAANVVLNTSSPRTSDLIDPIFGENWCIWGYKDIISAGRGICKLTLKKDSTWVPYFGLGGAMLPFN